MFLWKGYCWDTSTSIIFLSTHHCPIGFFISTNLLHFQRARSYPVPIAECPCCCKILLQPLCLVHCDEAASMPGELGFLVFGPPSEKRTALLLLAVLHPCCSQRHDKAEAVPEGTGVRRHSGCSRTAEEAGEKSQAWEPCWELAGIHPASLPRALLLVSEANDRK